jgi:hypothetical protein
MERDLEGAEQTYGGEPRDHDRAEEAADRARAAALHGEERHDNPKRERQNER